MTQNKVKRKRNSIGYDIVASFADCNSNNKRHPVEPSIIGVLAVFILRRIFVYKGEEDDGYYDYN